MVLSGSTFVRVVAIALLIASAFNFGAFDLRAGSLPAQNQSQSGDSCGDPGGGHDCFACCAHLIPPPLPALSVHFGQVSAVEHTEVTTRTSEPIPFFHPPKR